MAGILSCGAYVPLMRLQRHAVFEANRWFAPGLKSLAKGERAITSWDEDAVTMAVEASRRCLENALETPASVFLASTSAPFADRQNSGILKEALNLSDAVLTLDISGSQKAGTGALVQAFRSAASADGPILLAASENRRARPASEDELTNGDAAVALLIGPGDGVVRFVDSRSVSADFVDHFRTEGEKFDYGWETRWVREEGHAKLAGEALGNLLEAQGLTGADVARLVVGIPAKGAGAALARKAGIAADAVVDDLSAGIGYAGCAHALLMLVRALEDAKAGDRIVVLGYGQGVDAILLEVTDGITCLSEVATVSYAARRSRPEANYLKYLAFAGHLDLELGKRAEFDQKPVLTALYRNRKAVLGLVGGKCTVTGTVQYPRSEISVNQNQASVGTQEDYPFAHRPAKVMTYTADSLTYTPDPPNYYGMIEFEGGGRMLVEFADADAESVFVGAPVRMVFRVKARDVRSGFIKYFWKAVPAGSE
jgi:3-hydroxy-3-methylglutaryl CoA synthase